MSPSTLNITFTVLTSLVASVAWVATRLNPVGSSSGAGFAKKQRFMQAGALALVAYSVARDVAIVEALRGAGVSPWPFLFVDVVSLAPYLLAVPRAAGAALTGRTSAFVGWAACLAFGALAPITMVALLLRETASSASSLAAVYLACLVTGSAIAIGRKWWRRGRSAATNRLNRQVVQAN